MTQALKTRLAAEIAEHEKTHAEKRSLEKENANLRGLVGDQQRQYAHAVNMLQEVATKILSVFPKGRA